MFNLLYKTKLKVTGITVNVLFNARLPLCSPLKYFGAAALSLAQLFPVGYRSDLFRARCQFCSKCQCEFCVRAAASTRPVSWSRSLSAAEKTTAALPASPTWPPRLLRPTTRRTKVHDRHHNPQSRSILFFLWSVLRSHNISQIYHNITNICNICFVMVFLRGHIDGVYLNKNTPILTRIRAE